MLDARGAVDERVERSAIPGSPDDPPSPDALRQKLRGCLRDFEDRAGKPFPGFSGPRLSAPAEGAGVAVTARPCDGRPGSGGNA